MYRPQDLVTVAKGIRKYIQFYKKMHDIKRILILQHIFGCR